MWRLIFLPESGWLLPNVFLPLRLYHQIILLHRTRISNLIFVYTSGLDLFKQWSQQNSYTNFTCTRIIDMLRISLYSILYVLAVIKKIASLIYSMSISSISSVCFWSWPMMSLKSGIWTTFFAINSPTIFRLMPIKWSFTKISAIMYTYTVLAAHSATYKLTKQYCLYIKY